MKDRAARLAKENVIKTGEGHDLSNLFKRIDTVFLPVKDLGRAIEWYTATLGLELRWRHGNYAALNVSETPLTLYEPDDFRPVGNAGFNFYVTDIEAAHRTLKDAGSEVFAIQEGGGVRFFDFKDPDGNMLSVCWFPQ